MDGTFNLKTAAYIYIYIYIGKKREDKSRFNFGFTVQVIVVNLRADILFVLLPHAMIRLTDVRM